MSDSVFPTVSTDPAVQALRTAAARLLGAARELECDDEVPQPFAVGAVRGVRDSVGELLSELERWPAVELEHWPYGELEADLDRRLGLEPLAATA